MYFQVISHSVVSSSQGDDMMYEDNSSGIYTRLDRQIFLP